MRKHISCMIGIVGLCSLLTMTAFSYGWAKEGDRWCYTVKYSENSINEKYLTNDYIGEKADGTTEVASTPSLSGTGYTALYCIKDGYMVTNSWIAYSTGSEGGWRYFGSDGKMLINATTPDGYTVNENGYWIQNGVVVYDDSAKASALSGESVGATTNNTSGATNTSNNSSTSTSTTTSQSTTTTTSTSDGLTGFWGSDRSLTYSALRSLYSKLKDPDSLKVKSVKCITFDSTLGSGENVTCRMAIITCYAKNSFGGVVKDEYAYEIRSNGKTNYGDYTKITPYRVMYGDYRDARNIENVQEILDEVIKDYWK